MFYINAQPNASGNYGNPKGQPFSGSVTLPADLLSAYIEAKGFVIPAVEDGVVASLEVNQGALDAYHADHPETPEPDPTPTVEDRVTALESAIERGLSL